MHLRAPIRALFALLAFSAVSLSVDAQEPTYSVVFSNSTSFDKKVEVSMVAALYRDKDKDGNVLSADIKHTKDNSRWQISLKYDDPRWKGIDDGTVYWYIKSPDGKKIIGPSTNEEDMDDGKDNSATTASVQGRMFYKSEGSLKTTDGTASSFTYFKCTKGKDKAVSCTFAYAAADYEKSGNNGSELTYSNPSVQYWRNKSGIKYDLGYNTTSSSSIALPYYDGTFCYVKKPDYWDKIYAYAYISDNDKQTADWHGDQLTTTAEYDGQTYYLWKMGSDKKGTPAKIIFNNGDKQQQQQQTPGGSNAWDFTNGGIYDATNHNKMTDYIIGTVTKQSDATDPTAAYEKFYAYGFWGEGDKSFKEMSPVVYYNANNKNVVDSVVYYVNMSKVKASFDNFFFMFCSQRYRQNWDNWTTNGSNGAWDFVWRPEIFDNRDCNTLSGALYQPGNDLSNVSGSNGSGASFFTGGSNNKGFKTSDDGKGKNQMQSINPLLKDDQKLNYDSYTLSLNVTTGTYNIEFHNAIQIVGPAVVSGTNWTVNAQRKYTSNDATCGTWDKRKAITLKPSDDGTYYYTTVTLRAGEKFRFIENNKYLTNFGEDDFTPSATDFAPEKENGDVCYYNHIRRNTLTEDADPQGTSGESGLGNDITFTMPGLSNGETYETEIRVSAGNPFDQQMTGKAAPFYTITRPVKLFNYGSDNKGYTSFACNYPLEIVSGTDVKVYDIISYEMNKNKVTLRDKSSDYKANSKQYIPAKSGVILSATASDNESNESNVSTITVRPLIEKLGETVNNGSNLLKAVYLPGTTINMTLPETSVNTGDPVDSRQYLFSWVKQSDGSYKLGFLRSKTGKSVSERAYLSLTGEAVGATTLNPSDQAAYERVEGISTDDSSLANAKEYQVNLFFEGSEDDTTGIHTLNHQIADNEGYYTLQGIRVNKPTTAGIYIHNGKKIVVK
ncbi:MAG: starch-binding protein [Prevotella sp.]|nr:starch-binding protein [Prevotella sp.]